MNKIIFILLIVFPLLFSACNKDTQNTTDNTVTEKLTAKNWVLKQSGADRNGNGFPDDDGIPGNDELKYSDTTVTFNFMLNTNGTGSFTFSNPDTSASAALTWALDPTDTYITSTVPALSKTVVSKIITISNSSILGVLDTSANPKYFVYFTRDGL